MNCLQYYLDNKAWFCVCMEFWIVKKRTKCYKIYFKKNYCVWFVIEYVKIKNVLL